ncbi:unnamed protein product [Durusdinium trenchii]|uniref:Uncharacterized protein n=1 Tax=Durusdinium trenchii TaxID=1381693 RepID=A0ABP0P2G9_9DINO
MSALVSSGAWATKLGLSQPRWAPARAKLRLGAKSAKADVVAAPMSIPISFALWPLTRRSPRKTPKKRQREKPHRAKELVKPQGPKLPMELKTRTPRKSKRKGESFMKETDLDAPLKAAASKCPAQAELQSRAKILEKMSNTKRTWKWTAGPYPATREDCPNPDNPDGSDESIARLAHGLQSVVMLRGRLVSVRQLPLEKQKEVSCIAQPEDINWDALPPFVPAHKDRQLEELARKNGCRFFTSTSSLTGLLSRCYFVITRHRGFDPLGLGDYFAKRYLTFSPSTRWPTVVYLRRNDAGDAWSVTAGDDGDEENVLADYGLSMEHQLTTPKPEFEARFVKAKNTTETKPDLEQERRAYRFWKVGRTMIRSQLDAVHEGQVFDLKTRAVYAIRHNVEDYRNKRAYRIKHIRGAKNSFELEIYEMMRNAFMKYGFQAKIGRMDGIFVAYHNTLEIFGFQYIPLDDMERCIYGSRTAADVAFDLSVQMLEQIFQILAQDPALAATGTIKVQMSTEDGANSGRGNVLYLANG